MSSLHHHFFSLTYNPLHTNFMIQRFSIRIDYKSATDADLTFISHIRTFAKKGPSFLISQIHDIFDTFLYIVYHLCYNAHVICTILLVSIVRFRSRKAVFFITSENSYDVFDTFLYIQYVIYFFHANQFSLARKAKVYGVFDTFLNMPPLYVAHNTASTHCLIH